MRVSKRRRLPATIGLVVTVVLATAAPAMAQTTDDDQDDRNDLIVFTGSLVVPEGETVDAAVIFDGPARVEGTVTQTLVVFNGDAEISGTVRKDVLVFNGDVTVRSGGEVGGDLVSQETPVVESGATVRGDQQRVSGEIDWGDVGFASRFAWWIAFSISTLVLGLLLLLVAPALDAAVTRVVRERFGAAAGFGALWFFLLPIVAVLLLVTVVGIPLGIFVLLALALIYTVAYVAGIHGVGRLVMKPPSSRYVAFLVGWVILRLVALVPFLGGLAWWLVAMFGLGLLFVAARRSAPASETELARPEMPPRPA